jgi:hypothetical protein
MKRSCELVAVLLALGWITEARAQIGIGIGFTGRRVTGFVTSGYAGYGYAYPRGVIGYPSYGRSVSVSNITIISPPPPPAQPIIIMPPPPVIIEAQRDPEINIRDPIVIRPRRPAPEEMPVELPGAPAGGFRPIRPEDRARAQQPANPDVPVKPPIVKPVQPPAKNEYERLLARGRDAFNEQQYGRSLRLYQQATEARPDQPLGYFLLAEAQLALGKYREAVAAIHSGLKLQRDWPASKFQPRKLYEANAADYAQHMDQLAGALRQNRQDPALLFLYAYELWFDGQEDEARLLFRRAAKLVADPRFIELFLQQGQMGDPIAAR